MTRLSELRLDPDRIHRIRDVTIRRDVISIAFERGVIAFLEPVAGRVTGAVFAGSGDVLLVPPDDIERRQVYRFTGSPILTESFDAAIIRFTDDSHEEILGEIAARAAEDVRAEDLEALLPWEENIGRLSVLQNPRIMKDLVEGGDAPFFFGMLRGDRHGWFDVLYDETLDEEVRVSASAGGAGAPDVWASFDRRSEARDPERAAEAAGPSIDVLAYELDTTIEADASLTVRAEVRFRASAAGERAVAFRLSPTLRVRSVRSGRELLPVFQHDPDAGAASPGGRNDLWVVAPAAMAPGEERTLVFEYDGRVLGRRGRFTYHVNEGNPWYPAPVDPDAATFDLRFHYPAAGRVVATGRLEEEAATPGVSHARWTTDGDVFRAGFVFGRFAVQTGQVGTVPAFLHLNDDVAAVYQELSPAIADGDDTALREFLTAPPGDGPARSAYPPEFELLRAPSLGANILDELDRAVGFLTGLFGPFPFDRLSVAQFPVDFLEGWPSMLNVATLSFLGPGQRQRMGFGDSPDPLESEFERTRDLAHQWVGGRLAWRSYRDEWIREGLAGYAGLLYLDAKYPDAPIARTRLERLRGRLLTTRGVDAAGGGATNDDTGPIALGYRLSSSAQPGGYVETVRTKAPWVFHMLRHLMSDPSAPGAEGAAFARMVQALVGEFEGRAVSTREFQSLAERYMTERMDLAGDGTLDWFFGPWVGGTGVPEYALDYTVSDSGGGFRVAGAVTDAGAGFSMPVPVYARTPSDAAVYLGDVVVRSGRGTFSFLAPERPSEILIDPFDTILKR